ncbi:GNAT family N-acetyltransferase [Actinoplanes sp. KI2]|uniref:GNAT family N-acetyltransferase n=1 Tax=Actinoplanes sp. KI2 TaxID=2983315 RepID=UPI0021D579BB|nr:GNAT family N-acetyltransferase [Actinoplanes sp. KI2]MCU7724739.1 GNAT family N-acetyltransferase [Actinoplanes sp. KI2]
MIARPATPDDADELVRLRAVLLTSMNPPIWDDAWRTPSHEALTTRLSSPTLAAFVVDRPDGTGLAACAVGTIEHRLGAPGDPEGRSGYVFSVATDPDMRRRGFSRQCMTALLEWFRAQGVRKIDLRASAEAEPLYRSLGFTRTPDPAMRLRLNP